MAFDALLPSATRNAGTAQSGNYSAPASSNLRAYLQVTASVAPTSLNATIEGSEDGGNTWFSLGAFTQVGAVATASQSIQIAGPIPPIIRVNYTIVGTSYTFSVYLRRA